MGKLEQNNIIINKINLKLSEKGIKDKLLFEPIENTFKVRPKFGVYKDGTQRFSAFLWQLNTLDDEELDLEIEFRIQEARNHFHI